MSYRIGFVALAIVGWAGVAVAGGPPLSEEGARLLAARFESRALPEDLPAGATLGETVAALLQGDSGPVLIVFDDGAAQTKDADRTPLATMFSTRFGLADFVGVHMCHFVNDPGVCARLMIPRVFRWISVDTSAWSAERREAARWCEPSAVVVAVDGGIARGFPSFQAGSEWDVLAAMKGALDPETAQRLTEAGCDFLVNVLTLAEGEGGPDRLARVRSMEAKLGLRQVVRPVDAAEPEKKTAAAAGG